MRSFSPSADCVRLRLRSRLSSPDACATPVTQPASTLHTPQDRREEGGGRRGGAPPRGQSPEDKTEENANSNQGEEKETPKSDSKSPTPHFGKRERKRRGKSGRGEKRQIHCTQFLLLYNWAKSAAGTKDKGGRKPPPPRGTGRPTATTGSDEAGRATACSETLPSMGRAKSEARRLRWSHLPAHPQRSLLWILLGVDVSESPIHGLARPTVANKSCASFSAGGGESLAKKDRRERSEEGERGPSAQVSHQAAWRRRWDVV